MTTHASPRPGTPPAAGTRTPRRSRRLPTLHPPVPDPCPACGRGGPLPASTVIASHLASRIVGGQLRRGDPVPSEHELCREFGVARKTVRAAMALLRSWSLIVTEPHVGSYVSAPPVHPEA